jgi:hypothetical protein
MDAWANIEGWTTNAQSPAIMSRAARNAIGGRQRETVGSFQLIVADLVNPTEDDRPFEPSSVLGATS